MQFRARDNDFRLGLPPAEVNQCLVWLEGIDDYFFVLLDAPSGDRDVELGMCDLLMQCFDRGRAVKLEYWPAGAQRFISALWAND